MKCSLNCVILCYDRNSSCNSYVGNHIAHDSNHVIGVALPLDPCPDLHFLIAAC